MVCSRMQWVGGAREIEDAQYLRHTELAKIEIQSLAFQGPKRLKM